MSFNMKFNPFMKGIWSLVTTELCFQQSHPGPAFFCHRKEQHRPRTAGEQGRWPIIVQPAWHLQSIFLTTVWQACSRAASLLSCSISLYFSLSHPRKAQFPHGNEAGLVSLSIGIRLVLALPASVQVQIETLSDNAIFSRSTTFWRLR